MEGRGRARGAQVQFVTIQRLGWRCLTIALVVETMARQPQGIQSVDAVFRLIEALTTSSRAMTLTELAQAVGMTVSNTHRYLVSLLRSGLIRQETGSSRYRLGPSAIRTGLAALRQTDGFEAASRAMVELRDAINMPVFISIWTTEGPTMVRWLDASHSITVNVKPGSRSPVLNGASGRVFLAFENPERLRPVLEAEMRSAPGRFRTMADVEALQHEVRKQGVSHVLGERTPGIHGVSAPIFDAYESLVFSLTSVGLENEFDASYEGEFAQAVKAAARQASRELGYDEAAAEEFRTSIALGPSARAAAPQVAASRKRTAAEPSTDARALAKPSSDGQALAEPSSRTRRTRSVRTGAGISPRKSG